MSWLQNAVPMHQPSLKTEYFKYVTTCLTWTITCWVLHDWKSNGTQCFILILQTEIKKWMSLNLLKLNSNKTELMVVAPKVLLRKVGNLVLTADGPFISPYPEVCNNCVLNSTQAHIKSVTKLAFYHLKNFTRLNITPDPMVKIHTFVTSHLYYCNGVLFRVPSKALDRIQHVQNSAARGHPFQAVAAHYPISHPLPLAPSQFLHHPQNPLFK